LGTGLSFLTFDVRQAEAARRSASECSAHDRGERVEHALDVVRRSNRRQQHELIDARLGVPVDLLGPIGRRYGHTLTITSLACGPSAINDRSFVTRLARRVEVVAVPAFAQAAG
jgi:hypothetical protein